MTAEITTPDAYRRALERMDRLRDAGATAETNDELAALEGAVARYTAKEGVPAREPGHPPPGDVAPDD